MNIDNRLSRPGHMQNSSDISFKAHEYEYPHERQVDNIRKHCTETTEKKHCFLIILLGANLVNLYFKAFMKQLIPDSVQ